MTIKSGDKIKKKKLANFLEKITIFWEKLQAKKKY